VLVLAVKPQRLQRVLEELKGSLVKEQLVVSVVAGARIATIAEELLHASIVRTMPNTPAQIGMSMTVAVANANVTEARRAVVDRLFAAIGARAWIDDEGLLDAVTAVSGSGPAYVFLLAECLAEAARAAGLSEKLASLLARQTVAGSGALLAASDLAPAVLRQNVTSPGGTTAAALRILMDEGGLQPLLTRAVEAARKRSIELG